MNILYNTVNHFVSLIAPTIEFGIYDDPDVEKWGYYDENGVLGNMFFIGADLTTATIDPEDIPEDYHPFEGKYLFIDGEFVINPDWAPPEEPVEVRINRLEEALAELAEIILGGEE